VRRVRLFPRRGEQRLQYSRVGRTSSSVGSDRGGGDSLCSLPREKPRISSAPMFLSSCACRDSARPCPAWSPPLPDSVASSRALLAYTPTCPHATPQRETSILRPAATLC
jgi:hypothetical protein